MDTNNKFLQLLKAYLDDSIREDDKQELSNMLAQTDSNQLDAILENIWNETNVKENIFTREESAQMLLNILGNRAPAKVVPFYQRKWVRMIAASCFILGLAGLLFTFLQPFSPLNRDTAVNNEIITPGGNKATLTLADGTTITLDSASNGSLAQQGGVTVVKLDNGLLAYEPSNATATEMLQNTISTPAGGQYQLTLSDGTKVWLNAASSLRFPAAFTGNDRQVSITGEAYFEVAKNTSKPFKIQIANSGMVEVVGTSFNINSYTDEPSINTTLLEGSVKITSLSGESNTLKPGQQAKLKESITILNDVDTDAIVAWKTGWFQFNRADLPTIMRQVSRWYNVTVAYEGNFSKKSFSGIVSRENDIADVLKIMENAGIRFRIVGKTITVLE
jgi:ferric-dicitrate binding protein FerR (iron transport regulator)